MVEQVSGKTIRTFQDLEVWRVGRAIRNRCYEIADKLPQQERYNLASQIRCAAVSLTANVAQGYGRFHFNENIQFCRISRGSAYELIDHLITRHDLDYFAQEHVESLQHELLTFIRLLNGHIRCIGTDNRKQDSQ
jgi:four helix bundle protein